MSIYDLFNVPKSVPAGDVTIASDPASPSREGAFVNSQTFFSFPAMTGLISLAVSVLQKFGLDHVYVGAVLCAICGLFLFYLHESDPNGVAEKRLTVRIGIAFANTLQLFAAVYGIGAAT